MPNAAFINCAASSQNTNLSVISTLTLDKTPLCIAVNDETNRVYIGVYGGIIVIDGATKQTVTTIPFFDSIDLSCN